MFQNISCNFTSVLNPVYYPWTAFINAEAVQFVVPNITVNNKATVLGTGDAEVTTEPTIQSDTHIGDYEIKLTKPGDSVVYTFEVANTGSIDAALDSYTFATPTITGTGDTAAADATIVQSNLVYTLTYEDGTAIQVNDALNKESTRTLKLTVADQADADTLPANTVTISDMDVTFVYGQK